MKLNVEFLYMPDCPTWKETLKLLKSILTENQFPHEINLIEIRDEEDALHYDFHASPTIRINGIEIPPGEREHALGCRIFIHQGKVNPVPPRELLENHIKALALLSFMQEGIRLKLMPRSGWWYYGIKNPESVADHVYSMSLMALLLAEYLKEMGEDIDTGKVVKMALIHELGETKIGDIHLEARRYIDREKLDEAEERAFSDVVGILGKVSESLRELYREFDERSSREALIVRAADKLELLFQAYMYEKFGYRNLEAFWETKENFRDFFHYDFLKVVFELIRKLREANVD